MKLVLLLLLSFLLMTVMAKKKKDPRDYTDADIYALDEQWLEEDDIDEGDLPEHKRPQPKMDFSKMNMDNPDDMLKATKKGKTLMMFATVSGNPTRQETEEITSLWQSQLSNGHITTERYVIDDHRILIKIEDGSYSVEIKNFLISQERCEMVTLDGKDYPGKSSAKHSSNKPKNKKKKQKSINKAKEQNKKSKKVEKDSSSKGKKNGKKNTIKKNKKKNTEL